MYTLISNLQQNYNLTNLTFGLLKNLPMSKIANHLRHFNNFIARCHLVRVVVMNFLVQIYWHLSILFLHPEDPSPGARTQQKCVMPLNSKAMQGRQVSSPSTPWTGLKGRERTPVMFWNKPFAYFTDFLPIGGVFGSFGGSNYEIPYTTSPSVCY